MHTRRGPFLTTALALALLTGLAACDTASPENASASASDTADTPERRTTPEGRAAMRARVRALAGARPEPRTGEPEKVALCHRTEANTEPYELHHAPPPFVRLVVASPDVPAHLDHGDGLIGDAVPGQPGFAFADDCSIVESAVACPCYDAETLERAYDFNHEWVTMWDAEYVWQGDDYRTVVLDNDVPSFVWNFWVERINGVHSCWYGIYSLDEGAFEDDISAAEAEACRLVIYEADYAPCEGGSVYGESNSCDVPFTENRLLAARHP